VLSAFITHIDTVFPELRESSFLIACSGGVDSTVLAHLCHKADLSFALAHVNYQLRDAESDADAQFTASLADEFGVPYYSTSFDTAALKVEEEGSLQQIARKLRYSWFDELLEQEDFTYVVTAHHRDDNLETFLIHVLRGTGIDGLTGIPAKRGQIRRPLLQFSKEEIQVYAGENKLQWREDKTNETDDYLRNTVRHKLVPVFKELNPDILSALETTQDHLINSSKIVNNEIQRIKKQLFTYKNNRIEIDIKGLKSLMTPRAYLFPLLTPYGFTDWPAIEELLEAESGKKVYSGTHVLLKDRNTWILEEITPNKENKKTLEEAADSLFNMLEIEEVASFEKGDANTLYIDKESLNHRLRVRNWQKGDYFYPQGMGGKRKKLSKYYKDIKLDVLKKPRQWLLCDGDEIVWVIGKRGDERYKVTDKTKKILRIKVIK